MDVLQVGSCNQLCLKAYQVRPPENLFYEGICKARLLNEK